MKKVNGPRADNHYVDLHTGAIRTPEYTTMSRKPGIGHGWLEQYRDDVYPADEVISNGRAARPPRYYDQLQAEHDPASMVEIKERRSAAGSKHDANNTPKRLAVREAVSLARTKTLAANSNLT